jgi:hypothetical protein
MGLLWANHNMAMAVCIIMPVNMMGRIGLYPGNRCVIVRLIIATLRYTGNQHRQSHY